MKNAGVENAGVDYSAPKCREWKMQEIAGMENARVSGMVIKPT